MPQQKSIGKADKLDAKVSQIIWALFSWKKNLENTQ